MVEKQHYLREWRRYRGMTQVALAERSGRSQSAITEYETGKSAMSLHAQGDLARALDIEPYQLLLPPGESDQAPPARPARPSLDAILADADDDLVSAAAEMVRLLLTAARGRRDR